MKKMTWKYDLAFFVLHLAMGTQLALAFQVNNEAFKPENRVLLIRTETEALMSKTETEMLMPET